MAHALGQGVLLSGHTTGEQKWEQMLHLPKATPSQASQEFNSFTFIIFPDGNLKNMCEKCENSSADQREPPLKRSGCVCHVQTWVKMPQWCFES